MTTLTEGAVFAQVDKLSTEELERLLATRKESERKEAQRRRTEYEQTRDLMVRELCKEAMELNKKLQQFKAHVFEVLTEFYKQMQEYSGTERDSKGNFQVKSNDERFKVLYARQTVKGYDERAGQAEVLLKDFMQTFVKKRDKQTYSLLMALLERNSVTGDYDPNLINKLVKRRGEFDDERWLKAIDLFVESWSEVKTVDYARFFVKNDQNAWVNIPLSFSAIPVQQH